MDRRIKATKKDRNGSLIALCNPDEKWSPVPKDAVLRDIKSARHSYCYVRATSQNALQTTSDKASKNNLDNLPTI